MEEARHQNIFGFLDAHHAQKIDTNQQLLICSKYLPNGSLHKYIKGMINHMYGNVSGANQPPRATLETTNQGHKMLIQWTGLEVGLFCT